MGNRKAPSESTPPKSLRQKAEESLGTSRREISDMRSGDIQKLVQELQVHQMELEIQNEELRVAQVELAESRDRYRDLYEFAPIGYITFDRDGNILRANLGAAELLEVSRDRLLGMRVTDLIDPQGQDRWHRHRQAVLSSSQKKSCELPLNKPSGEAIWARAETMAVPVARGDVPLYFMALIDVTERKLAEDQLLQLQAELEHRVTERTSAVAMLHDIATVASKPIDVEEAVIYVLQRVCEHNGWNCGHAWLPAHNDPATLYLGYASHELDSAHVARLRKKSMNTRLCRGEGLVGRVYATGRPEFTNDVANDLSIDEVCPDEYADVRAAVAFPILTDHEMVGVLEFFSAEHIESSEEKLCKTMASVGTLLGRVIERKRAEMALRERETRLQAVLDTAADAIISIDRQGLIVDVNPATERMFGYTRDELISQNIRILMPPPHQEAHNHYLARYLRTREARIIGTGRELAAKRKDGSTFPVSLTVTELDRLGLFTGFIRDISQRKSLEKQVVDAAAEEQRRIGQDIHDGIGQELTGLRYMAQTHAELLARHESPETKTAQRMTRWLEIVQQQIRTIIRRLVPVEVDRLGLTTAFQELVRQTSDSSGLACEFHCPRPITVADTALATHLYRIVQEAVGNAVRHANATKVRIELTEDEAALTLKVIDNGVGIGTTQKEGEGFGLRSMAYRAGLIGGTLSVRTGEQGGTQLVCTVLRDSTAAAESR